MTDLTMQAVRFHIYGGPEVLKLEEVPRPEPKQDQVLIRVAAAGVNPADWKLREGRMQAFRPIPLPWIPGSDGSGTIEALGPGVSAFSQGQAVYGLFQSYAAYAIAAVGDLQPKPENITFEQAATVPVGALTAWSAVEASGVKAGQKALVQGAAGGVGMFVVQLARLKGAYVIGTASSANLDFVESLGAEEAIDYHQAPLETVLNDLDVVIDTVGGDVTRESLKLVRRGGTLVTVVGRPLADPGQSQGIQVFSAGRAPAVKLADINQLIASDQLETYVGAVFPLSEARQAQEMSQTGHGRGRIVLKVAQ